MSRVQLLEASAPYQVLVLAAAIDAGALPPADRRILLFSVNAPIPEVGIRIEEEPGVAPLLGRFDAVASYNDLVFPLHPTAFKPRVGEQPLFERAFRSALGIAEDDDVELVLESVQTAPSRTILNVFATALVTVYAEGLMSYGPTRNPLNGSMTSRIDRLLHLDLVPGLAPVLLTEYGIPSEAIDPAAFRRVVRELRLDEEGLPEARSYALVLGQYLGALGLLSPERERAVNVELLRAAADRGFRSVVFKPHPAAPLDHVASMAAAAASLGVELVVHSSPVPAEALYERRPPGLVLGCFSTGLVTAMRYWDLPAVRTATGEVLARLPRFEDSNRVPLTLVERTVPPLESASWSPTPLDQLQRLLLVVAYCMQWQAQAAERDRVIEILRSGSAGPLGASVPRTRLRSLLLPGGGAVTLSAPAFTAAQDSLMRLRQPQGIARRLLGKAKGIVRRLSLRSA